LGWPEDERSHKQIVWLDIEFFFPSPPKACISDNLADTFCYDKLTKLLQEHVEQKEFHLIEHLTYEIHRFIKNNCSDQTKVNISITKKPAIPGLTGGVCFRCEDKS